MFLYVLGEERKPVGRKGEREVANEEKEEEEEEA